MVLLKPDNQDHDHRNHRHDHDHDHHSHHLDVVTGIAEAERRQALRVQHRHRRPLPRECERARHQEFSLGPECTTAICGPRTTLFDAVCQRNRTGRQSAFVCVHCHCVRALCVCIVHSQGPGVGPAAAGRRLEPAADPGGQAGVVPGPPQGGALPGAVLPDEGKPELRVAATEPSDEEAGRTVSQHRADGPASGLERVLGRLLRLLLGFSLPLRLLPPRRAVGRLFPQRRLLLLQRLLRPADPIQAGSAGRRRWWFQTRMPVSIEGQK